MISDFFFRLCPLSDLQWIWLCICKLTRNRPCYFTLSKNIKLYNKYTDWIIKANFTTSYNVVITPQFIDIQVVETSNKKKWIMMKTEKSKNINKTATTKNKIKKTIRATQLKQKQNKQTKINCNKKSINEQN